MPYEPTLASLKTHPVPEWFADAKFGIFIHWGLFSVPGFAAKTGPITDTFRDNYEMALADTPYAEWYCNSIKTPASAAAKYHKQVWKDTPYDDFREVFRAAQAQWKPEEWADLFAEAGARYIVLVTKHHDGYTLWPSAVKNPHKPDWNNPRDLVGELAKAVRAKGIKFGVYYSTGLDWSFNPEPLRTLGEMMGSGPGGDYPDYCLAQMRELFAAVKPDIVWNDISFPTSLDPMLQLFADYYNEVPGGAINDRGLPVFERTQTLRTKEARAAMDARVKAAIRSPDWPGLIPAKPPHYDYRTPEYTLMNEIQSEKWETARGLALSFGYNRMDTDEDHVPVAQLVREFVDSVAKNGNMLLNVGPRGEDAQIPQIQKKRLKGFGQWLKANGEAIYGTRPWIRAAGRTDGRIDVRFTAKGEALYAHLLGTPAGNSFVIEGRDLPAAAHATHLATGDAVRAERTDAGLKITLSKPLIPAPAHGFKLQ